MKAKWNEMWGNPEISNPQEGSQSYHSWFYQVSVAYERWRIPMLAKAR